MKKFKKGEIVYFTIEGMNAGELMVATIPRKYFELDKAYIIDQIGTYGNGKHILVKGSSQFVHEKYFKRTIPEVKKSKIRRKYETIKIDGKDYYLIPKEE